MGGGGTYSSSLTLTMYSLDSFLNEKDRLLSSPLIFQEVTVASLVDLYWFSIEIFEKSWEILNGAFNKISTKYK